eukprot:6079311-Pyramimonas_sp.AAC.1
MASLCFTPASGRVWVLRRHSDACRSIVAAAIYMGSSWDRDERAQEKSKGTPESFTPIAAAADFLKDKTHLGEKPCTWAP